jgi:hypothetical protein
MLFMFNLTLFREVIMKNKMLCALGTLILSCSAQAASELPLCFQTESSDSLGRLYIVTKDSQDPLALIASPDRRAVRVYEYLNRPGFPLSLQVSFTGLAAFSLYENLDLEWGHFGTVTGDNVGGESSITTRIDRFYGQGPAPAPYTWRVTRSTAPNSITEHVVELIDCTTITAN